MVPAEVFHARLSDYAEVRIPEGYAAGFRERVATGVERRPLVSGLSAISIVLAVSAVMGWIWYATRLAKMERQTLDATIQNHRNAITQFSQDAHLYGHLRDSGRLSKTAVKPVENKLVQKFQKLEVDLASSPLKGGAQPWLELCRAELFLYGEHYQEALDNLTCEPASDKPSDERERERAYWYRRHRGTALYHLGKWNDALAELARAAMAKPDDAAVRGLTGILYWRSNRPSEAIPILERTVSLIRAHPPADDAWDQEQAALYFLGMAFAENGQAAQAIDPLLRAQKLWEGHDLDWTYGNILIGLAGSYGTTGNHAKAISYANQAVDFFDHLPSREPVPAVDHNLGIGLIVRSFALWSTGDVFHSLADLNRAVESLKTSGDEARLAEAYFKRSGCVTRLAGIQATACVHGIYLAPSPFVPCLIPVANWLQERLKQQLTQAKLEAALADANESYRHYQTAGDELGLMQAKAQEVSCYSQAGDRPNAHRAIQVAIDLGTKAKSTDSRIKALLETLRRLEPGLRN